MLRLTLITLFTIIATLTRAQHIATFNVDLTRPGNGLSVPVEADLDLSRLAHLPQLRRQ